MNSFKLRRFVRLTPPVRPADSPEDWPGRIQAGGTARHFVSSEQRYPSFLGPKP
ncbi:hypothetical protein [Methylothermus subterraneus]